MYEAIGSPREAWGNFYVIVGAAAGALTGLQFVVMTLIAQTPRARGSGDTIAAFGTPNVVHFCSALLISAILAIPWAALWHLGFAVAGCGALGTYYSVVVILRAHRQQDYEPVFEDWLWHTILPVLAYGGLFVAGAMLERAPAGALLSVAAVTLLLVFIGIHNAWDTVTYVMLRSVIETRRTGGSAGPDKRAAVGIGTPTGSGAPPSDQAPDPIEPGSAAGMPRPAEAPPRPESLG